MNSGFRSWFLLYSIAVAASISMPVGSSLMRAALGVAYVLVVIGYVWSVSEETALGRMWLALVFILTVVPPVFFALILFLCLLVATEFDLSTLSAGEWIPYVLLIAGNLWVAVLVIHSLPLREGHAYTWEGSPILLVSLAAGAGFILISTILVFSSPAGLDMKRVLGGQWLGWRDSVSVMGGCVIYPVSLLATLGLVVLLIRSRFSMARVRALPCFVSLTGVMSLANLGLATNILWMEPPGRSPFGAGRQADAVVIGSGLAAIVIGVVLFLPLLKGKAVPWRLHALLVFQIPIILMLAKTFRLFVVPHFAWMGVLSIGLVIQSWACVELLQCTWRPDEVCSGTCVLEQSGR